MLPCNTILSSDLTTLIAQTSFYILTRESEVALQAASATAETSEFCSHVDLPTGGGVGGGGCAMQVTAKYQKLEVFRASSSFSAG